MHLDLRSGQRTMTLPVQSSNVERRHQSSVVQTYRSQLRFDRCLDVRSPLSRRKYEVKEIEPSDGKVKTKLQS